MAEIGLLPFARVALEVAKRVLPPYRSRFSKHQFTQPQLLAVLLLMRYEDWTFREAEVRLGEHRDLREVLQLQNVPDHTTLYRFLKRLEDDTLERGLGETVRRLRRGKTHGRVSAAVAGTGLSPQAVSTYFIRRSEQQNGGKPRYRHYLKWLVVVDSHSATLWRTKHYSGTTSPGCSARNPAQPDVPRFSSEKVWTTSESGNDLLRGETQTFLPRSRPQSEFTDPPSIAPRPRLQPVSPLASPRYRGSQQSCFNSL